MQYERSNIEAMQGYSSGEQPESADVIKLNTNENPYPPGPGVEKALAGIKAAALRRYPPPTASGLRKTLAAYHQVSEDEIVVTNGGDELLRLAFATFVETSDAVAVAEPSYSLYPVLAQAHGCRYLSFSLQEDWRLPPDFAARLNDSGAKMCMVVNPHAPSGTLIPAAELAALADAYQGLLLIDEAYVDFVDPALEHNCIPLLRQFDNVLLLRTFSKGYSLAGLRMAYGLGAKSLIDPMQYKTKDSYNTDYIAQVLATAAIEHKADAARTWTLVREQRQRVKTELENLGLRCPNSQSNFLLATVPAPYQAQHLYQALKDKGILVRYFKLPRLEDKLRITIGTEAENARLLTALKDIIG